MSGLGALDIDRAPTLAFAAMPTIDAKLQIFLDHVRGDKTEGQANPAVAALLDPEQPADVRALLELLTHVPFAAFESEMLRVAAPAVCAFAELEGASEVSADGFDPRRALVIGSQDSVRYLVATWTPGAASSKTFAYERDARSLTSLGGGLFAGITQFLHDDLNQRDDFFTLEIEDAEAELIEFADGNPALAQVLFGDIDLEDEELFTR
jgi:hypothetical protein